MNKYNLGDEVHYLTQYGIDKGIIIGISMTAPISITYTIGHLSSNSIHYIIGNISYFESKLFKTKQELINSL